MFSDTAGINRATNPCHFEPGASRIAGGGPGLGGVLRLPPAGFSKSRPLPAFG